MANMHLAALSIKHARLDAELTAEALHPRPDSLRMVELKKAKLRIKEQIARP